MRRSLTKNLSRVIGLIYFSLSFIMFASLSFACDLEYCALDWNFAAGVYSNCATLSDCISVTRNSGKWAAWRDGHYSYFAPNMAAVTDLGLLVEPEAKNYLRYSRDLSNDVWKKTNMAASFTSSGVDKAANSATTLTALESNAVVSQAVKIDAGPRNFSVFLRRRSGQGPVSISYDGGATWLPCDVSEKFKRCTTGIDELATSEVELKLDSKGDSIDVDYLQLEGQLWATSPIPTTDKPAARASDSVEINGKASDILKSGTFSFVLEGGGSPPRGYGNKSIEIIGGANASFFITPYNVKYIQSHNDKTGSDLYAALGWGSSMLLSQGSMSKHFKFAASSDEQEGVSLCADGGSPANLSSGYGKAESSWHLGSSYSGFITRLTIWDKKLDDFRLQSLSRIEIPAALVTDTDRPWTDYSVRDRITVNGSKFEVQSGIFLDKFTNTYPLQVGSGGNYFKFNQFANNTWAIDSSDPFKGSERVELAGNPLGSRARFDGHETDSIWISDSFYVERGDPVTADWTTVGQIHDRVGLGPVFGMSIQCGEYLSVDITGEGFVKTIGTHPIARGHWYNRVINLKFNQSGAGFVRVWINGVQIADYRGPTGNPATQYYYWKYGIYRSHAPEYVAVRYANVRIGGSELASKILAPDAIPTGYCTDNASC